MSVPVPVSGSLQFVKLSSNIMELFMIIELQVKLVQLYMKVSVVLSISVAVHKISDTEESYNSHIQSAVEMYTTFSYTECYIFVIRL